MKVNIVIGKVAHREYTDSGTMNIMMKLMHAPVKKRPNITCETTRMSLRISSTCADRATTSR